MDPTSRYIEIYCSESNVKNPGTNSITVLNISISKLYTHTNRHKFIVIIVFVKW